jgi:hypothetical protein
MLLMQITETKGFALPAKYTEKSCWNWLFALTFQFISTNFASNVKILNPIQEHGTF